MVAVDPHYFHPTVESEATEHPVCAKCGKGPHGLSYASYTLTDVASEVVPARTADAYDASEQDKVIDVFVSMLRAATGDGGRKRAAGVKPPWYVDDAHEAAIFSHLSKWKHGEKVDPDSGAHPLVHLAWRALAIAYRETFGDAEPGVEWTEKTLSYFSERAKMTPRAPCGVCQSPSCVYSRW